MNCSKFTLKDDKANNSPITVSQQEKYIVPIVSSYSPATHPEDNNVMHFFQILLMYIGFIFALFLGITAIVQIIITCLSPCFHIIGLIWAKYKSAANSGILYNLSVYLLDVNLFHLELDPKVLVSVETLHYFRNGLEQVVKQNKLHFKHAQQILNIGIRINAEKNALAGIYKHQL